jgi:hypothetical protein
MAQIKRKQFFQNLASEALTEKELPIYPYKDPSNTKVPNSLRKTSTGINPYKGVWTEIEIKHLCRRTLFGVSKADIDFFKTKSMSDAVDYILNTVWSPQNQQLITIQNGATANTLTLDKTIWNLDPSFNITIPAGQSRTLWYNGLNWIVVQ